MFFLILVTTGVAGAGEPRDSLLPEGISVGDTYKPGIGPPVGEIRQVSGTAVVIHKDNGYAYRPQQGHKLFKGDTVVTLADGYVGFQLNDDSFISLSSKTKLVIDKSVYAPQRSIRSTFINMVLGKSRFVVKKLVKARHSEFKVKTITSVAGVRGSDFIVAATRTLTEITALKDTELEVISLAAPGAGPAVLHDFERTRVRAGALPEAVHRVAAEEIDRLMKEFKFHPHRTIQKPGVQAPSKKEKAENAPEAPAPPVNPVYVSEDELVKPETQTVRPEKLKKSPVAERFKTRARYRDEQKVNKQQAIIYHQRYEDVKKTKLPDFPATPQ